MRALALALVFPQRQEGKVQVLPVPQGSPIIVQPGQR